jgi:hypothetical protein
VKSAVVQWQAYGMQHGGREIDPHIPYFVFLHLFIVFSSPKCFSHGSNPHKDCKNQAKITTTPKCWGPNVLIEKLAFWKHD